MSYSLEFLPSARKEWNTLGATLREQFKRKLSERLAHPHVQADALRAMPNHYRIKLRGAGYRLVYRVEEERVTVVVVTVGKRAGSAVYKTAKKRR